MIVPVCLQFTNQTTVALICLRTNPTIASFKKRIASFKKSSNIKIKSFANSNNKTKNTSVKSKVNSNFYRGKGRGKTREA